MGKQISSDSRAEVIKVLQKRYEIASKREKREILDQFVMLSGYHRKHAVRLLGASPNIEPQKQADALPRCSGYRIYNEAMHEALLVIWEAADRICGKRLKAIMPTFIDSLERHGHLHLDPEIRHLLLSVSAATIDRLLAPARREAKSRRGRRKPKEASGKIAVRTFADWGEPGPGYLEIDFVAHGGGSMAGVFIHSLVVTDISSQWTDFVPLLAREQSLVAEGLTALFQRIPFPVLGIDTDNDSAFINDTLLSFCEARKLEFTRCRAYRKNDQAWIEQKNGAVVRRLVGYERFSGVVAGQALAHLYEAARLYVNYFQPSFKLRDKSRQGAKVTRRYHAPATPCARLLQDPTVDEGTKERLRTRAQELDPLSLLHRIREGQAALAALVSPDTAQEGPGRQTLDQFLSQLPKLWRQGEVRPTHRMGSAKPRNWRTRKDPFADVWLDVLRWLQKEPDATAKELFTRLREKHPGRFPDGQLRTLQRRVKEWRKLLAKQLVYACIEPSDQTWEVAPVGNNSTCN